MKKKLIIPFVIIALATGACTYTDNEEYYVEPVPGDPATISVSTNLDTILDPTVIDSLEVIFQVVIQNGELYQVDAFVIDTFLYSNDTIDGAFWVPFSAVDTPGIDTLRMQFYYSTNTNSLADIVGVEADILDLLFPVNFMGGLK